MSANPIFAYTRSQAIKDGVLVDLDAHQVRGVPIRHLIGLQAHVAITCAAWGTVMQDLEPEAIRANPELEVNRLRDLLATVRAALGMAAALDFMGISVLPLLGIPLLPHRSLADSLQSFKTAMGQQTEFKFFPLSRLGELVGIDLKVICGLGDQREPVITILLPNED